MYTSQKFIPQHDDGDDIWRNNFLHVRNYVEKSLPMKEIVLKSENLFTQLCG